MDIGWVVAGNTSQNDYQFLDQTVVPGQRYFYRLRQIDFDGSEHLSEIVSAEVQGDSGRTGWTVYPNPVPLATFTVLSTGPVSADVQLYQQDGRLLRKWTSVRSGESLSVGDLPAGLYLLRINEQVHKLVIQR
ncbi:MAG: T9SS type A sorting domain-containing protein [Bacteroidota bacterium]